MSKEVLANILAVALPLVISVILMIVVLYLKNKK